MKTLTSRVIVVIMVAFCAVAAFGQSNMNLRGEIPFDFTVANQHLSSGTFTITNLMSRVDCMRDGNGRPTAFSTTVLTDKGDNKPRLVFHRYGTETVLAEIWSGTAAYEVSGAKTREKKLAKAAGFETVAMLLEPVTQ